MAARDDKEAQAIDRLNEVERLLGRIREEALRLAHKALDVDGWPAVGSLGHIVDVLAELAGERG